MTPLGERRGAVGAGAGPATAAEGAAEAEASEGLAVATAARCGEAGATGAAAAEARPPPTLDADFLGGAEEEEPTAERVTEAPRPAPAEAPPPEAPPQGVATGDGAGAADLPAAGAAEVVRWPAAGRAEAEALRKLVSRVVDVGVELDEAPALDRSSNIARSATSACAGAGALDLGRGRGIKLFPSSRPGIDSTSAQGRAAFKACKARGEVRFFGDSESAASNGRLGPAAADSTEAPTRAAAWEGARAPSAPGRPRPAMEVPLLSAPAPTTAQAAAASREAPHEPHAAAASREAPQLSGWPRPARGEDSAEVSAEAQVEAAARSEGANSDSKSAPTSEAMEKVPPPRGVTGTETSSVGATWPGSIANSSAASQPAAEPWGVSGEISGGAASGEEEEASRGASPSVRQATSAHVARAGAPSS